MASPARDSTSFGSLSNEIDNIYKNYASNGHDLEHSLDSSTAEPGYRNSPFLSINYPRTSLNRDTDGALQTGHSELGTPVSSNSFDFTPAGETEGYTNSSLNVLVGTPSSESAYRLLISSAPLIRGHHHLVPREEESLVDVEGDDDDLDSEEDIDVIEEPSSVISSTPADESKEEEDWVKKGAAVKEIPGEISPQVIRRTVEDFQFGKDLGEGSYSTVVLATDKITRKKYAVKILDKRHIIKEKKVKYVNIEKHALNRLSRCPGIISLFFTFQDKHSLYFVLDYASNGELLTLIKRHGTLNEECAKHLSAQILSAMKHMHDNGVIHRDIKPENILLDDKFRIKITDFGTAKLLEKKKKNGSEEEEEEYPLDVRAKSFVGTAEYVSPELLENKYCGKPGDIWAFGCILYQMIAGKPPFKATNEYLTFQKITKLQYAFSAGFPLILRDLIKQILVLQPSRRASIEQIQKHYFFNDVDFSDDDRIWTAEIPEVGPYKASAKSMMKMPASAKPATSSIVVKKATSKPSPKPSQNANRVPSGRLSENTNNGKGFSAASVAALVLNKSEEDNEPEQSSRMRPTPSSSSSSSSRPHAASEYIPGTNILRPTIHTMASFSRSQSGIKSDGNTSKKPKSRVMSVSPMSAVEIAWQEFLQLPSERIINVGQVNFCKQSTEFFERKHKGIVHDAPLGLVNKLQAMDNRDNGSFLSHMAQGKGFRESSTRDLALKLHPDNESDAITYYIDETESVIDSIPEEKESEPLATLTGSTTKIGKGLFRKFLSHADKKADTLADTNSVASAGSGGTKKSVFSLEKARPCTALVTTQGRLLVFTQKDQDSAQKLILEVRLNYPFIKFKEVITTGSKFTKMLLSTGIFAVQAILTTFVFEVDKFDVNKWTDSLAKSKINQYEREHEAEAKRKAAVKSTTMPSPRTPDMTGTAQASRHVSTGSENNRNHEEYVSSMNAKERSLPFFKARRKQSKNSKRRPPPPPLSHGLVGPSGWGVEGDRGEAGTVYAAQLAVSQSGHILTENRRSSFSKDGRREHASSPSHRPTGNLAAPAAKITPLNSKFLARSRGHK